MTFLPVAQAAAVMGVSDDTLRRRAKTGQVDTSTDALGRLLVAVPEDVAAAAVELMGRPMSRVGEAQADAEGARLHQELSAATARAAAAELAAEAAEKETQHARDMLAEVRSRAELLENEVTARRRESDELRVLLGQAQENVRGLLLPPATETGDATEQRRRWWQR